MKRLFRHPAIPEDADESPSRPAASRGQVLVIFAGTLTILLLMSALVIDLAWLWNNSLRIQRAADAAALAGVVHLPGNVPAAYTAARDGATRNGYATGAPGVTVTPTQDPGSQRRLNVKVTAPVQTFFLKLIGMETIVISRRAEAEYVLPVPMGSPLNYYGVYGTVRTPSGGQTVTTYGDTGAAPNPASGFAGNTWNTPGNVYTSNNVTSWTATSTTNLSSPTSGSWQAWTNFNLSVPGGAVIDGIEVYVEARHADPGCQVGAHLSWNNGSSWTSGTSGTDPGSKSAVLTTSDVTYTLGANNRTWGRTWTPSELGNGSFRVRLVNFDAANCNASQRIDIDLLRVKAYYHTDTWVPDGPVAGPSGETLAPQGFWGVMLSQGADSSSGDAYLPYYVQSSNNRLNPEHAVGSYYDYAVEMQPGSTGGKVHIFDPGFCNQGSFDLGTGDNYYGGSGAVSSFYTLWADDAGSPYNTADDRLVGTSGNTFRRQSGTCDAWHNAWYEVPLLSSQPEFTNGLSGGAGGRVYRLRASTYDPTDIAGQRTVAADNGFALFAKAATGASPRIYGIGAMEMLTPLPGGQTSTFYLAQIDAVHAGKTMEIQLWDPGDTNQNAYIQILAPNASGWSPVTTLSYTAKRGQLDPSSGSYIYNSGASNCDSNSSSSTDRIQTYQSSSRFNGCWLTIQIAIPSGYTAPQSGWWKISYTMQGSSGTNATDITTWQVNIRGNPVHLVQP